MLTTNKNPKTSSKKKTQFSAAPGASAENIVVTPPRVFPPNFVDPTVTWHVNERALFRPGGYRAFKRAEAIVNVTGYPFVYGYVPPPGTLKNATNATLKAVGVIGTAVNATATALNFTSPVAGLGNDLAQATNNAIKVKRREREFFFATPLRPREEKKQKIKILSKKTQKLEKQTTNAIYNLTVGKAINATVYKVRVWSL